MLNFDLVVDDGYNLIAKHRPFVALHSFGSVVARVWVDVMRLKIVSVAKSPLSRVGIDSAVCMECRLSEIGCKRRVWHESSLSFYMLTLEHSFVEINQ